MSPVKTAPAELTAGVSYQVNLVSRIKGCMRLAIFAPGTKTFDSGTPVGGLRVGYFPAWMKESPSTASVGP